MTIFSVLSLLKEAGPIVKLLLENSGRILDKIKSFRNSKKASESAVSIADTGKILEYLEGRINDQTKIIEEMGKQLDQLATFTASLEKRSKYTFKLAVFSLFCSFMAFITFLIMLIF